MVALTSTLLFGLFSSLVASAGPGGYNSHNQAADPQAPQTYQCGEVNILFTGLPAYHPLVGSQGFNQTAVDFALKNISAAIIQAGYNLKVAFLGPERPLTDLTQAIEEERGVRFNGAIIGAGIRASTVPELVVRFEDMLETIRTTIPRARFLFNNNVESTLPAIQRRFPLTSNCTSPGKDYGFNVYCDPQVCTNATVTGTP